MMVRSYPKSRDSSSSLQAREIVAKLPDTRSDEARKACARAGGDVVAILIILSMPGHTQSTVHLKNVHQ